MVTVTGVLATASYALVLLASRKWTPRYTVPAAAPVLFQSYALAVPYACTICQVGEVAGRSQNSYRALVQPLAVAVAVTCVPLMTLDGEAEIVTGVQEVVVTVTGVLAMASYGLGLFASLT